MNTDFAFILYNHENDDNALIKLKIENSPSLIFELILYFYLLVILYYITFSVIKYDIC